MSDSKKILLIGLDKAGKTSILLCLRGIKNLLSFYSLNPTRSVKVVNFKAFNSEYNIWDFGGQETFRKEYLDDFKKYLTGANKIIYVIDVQDSERYDLAIEYLENVVRHIRKYHSELEFSIFLHKFDPDLEKFNKNINEETLNSLINMIKEKMPEDFIYSVHKTSIYTIFEKSRLL